MSLPVSLGFNSNITLSRNHRRKDHQKKSVRGEEGFRDSVMVHRQWSEVKILESTSILSPFPLSLKAFESKMIDFCAFGFLAFHSVWGCKTRKESQGLCSVSALHRLQIMLLAVPFFHVIFNIYVYLMGK